jgi:hypothetical protein
MSKPLSPLPTKGSIELGDDTDRKAWDDLPAHKIENQASHDAALHHPPTQHTPTDDETHAAGESGAASASAPPSASSFQQMGSAALSATTSLAAAHDDPQARSVAGSVGPIATTQAHEDVVRECDEAVIAGASGRFEHADATSMPAVAGALHSREDDRGGGGCGGVVLGGGEVQGKDLVATRAQQVAATRSDSHPAVDAPHVQQEGAASMLTTTPEVATTVAVVAAAAWAPTPASSAAVGDEHAMQASTQAPSEPWAASAASPRGGVSVSSDATVCTAGGVGGGVVAGDGGDVRSALPARMPPPAAASTASTAHASGAAHTSGAEQACVHGKQSPSTRRLLSRLDDEPSDPLIGPGQLSGFSPAKRACTSGIMGDLGLGGHALREIPWLQQDGGHARNKHVDGNGTDRQTSEEYEEESSAKCTVCGSG